MKIEHINEEIEEQKPQAGSSKTGWIVAGATALVAIGIVVGFIVGTNDKLAEKDREIAKLKKDAETVADNKTDNNTDDERKPTEPTVKAHQLEGFDTKITDVFKLLKGNNSYLEFEKMVVSNDGEYMFIKGKEQFAQGSGALAQYYRSTDSNGTWKYYAGGNGFPSCSDFNEEQIKIAKKYAEEIGLIDVCTGDGTDSKKISDL